jgi:hypothetical protein
VTPASVPAAGSTPATITVKAMASGTVVRIGAAVLNAGAHDKVFSDVVLFDDGTHGDAIAGDGVYSSNEIKPNPGNGMVASGARIIRVRATVVDGGGKSHSTAIDVGGLAVQ